LARSPAGVGQGSSRRLAALLRLPASPSGCQQRWSYADCAGLRARAPFPPAWRYL